VSPDSPAISYKLLDSGTPVLASGGERLGTVDRVLENEREHIFDGIVLHTDDGERFVDAPEVARITETAVLLSITAAEAAELPAHEPGAPEYQANVRAGRVGRLFGGSWKRK